MLPELLWSISFSLLSSSVTVVSPSPRVREPALSSSLTHKDESGELIEASNDTFNFFSGVVAGDDSADSVSSAYERIKTKTSKFHLLSIHKKFTINKKETTHQHFAFLLKALLLQRLLVMWSGW